VPHYLINKSLPISYDGAESTVGTWNSTRLIKTKLCGGMYQTQPAANQRTLLLDSSAPLLNKSPPVLYEYSVDKSLLLLGKKEFYI
jgi:hypothetical protein